MHHRNSNRYKEHHKANRLVKAVSLMIVAGIAALTLSSGCIDRASVTEGSRNILQGVIDSGSCHAGPTSLLLVLAGAVAAIAYLLYRIVKP